MVYSMVFRAPLGPPQENIGILCEFPATEISRTSCIPFHSLVLAPVEAVKLTVTRAMLINSFTVQSPNVTYTDTHIESKYTCVSRPALYLFHTDATSCFPGTRTLSSDLKIVAMAARSGLFIPWSLLSSSRRTVESRSSGMSLSATQRATVSRPKPTHSFLCRIMLVGLGGNNGTTLVGGVIANREGITWKTKEGIRAPDYYGSLTQSSTCRVGTVNGQEIFTPFKALLQDG